MRGLVVIAFLLGCEGGHVRRVVTLAPEDGLPRGVTAVVGDTIRVEIDRIEPLQVGDFTAFARAGGTDTVLGPVAPGAAAIFPLPAAIEEFLIREGDASAPLTFRGRPQGPLFFEGYAGPNAEDLASASGSAVIDDGCLAIDVVDLPKLAGGHSYGMWLLAAEEALRADFDFETDDLLATHDELVVTVELDAGAPEPALTSIVLRGAIPKDDETAAVPTSGEDDGHGHTH